MKPMNVIEIKIVAKLLMCLPYFNSIQLPPFKQKTEYSILFYDKLLKKERGCPIFRTTSL